MTELFILGVKVHLGYRNEIFSCILGSVECGRMLSVPFVRMSTAWMRYGEAEGALLERHGVEVDAVLISRTGANSGAGSSADEPGQGR